MRSSAGKWEHLYGLSGKGKRTQQGKENELLPPSMQVHCLYFSISSKTTGLNHNSAEGTIRIS